MPHGAVLVISTGRRMLNSVKGKWLPVILMLLFAISRAPGVFPKDFASFSAAYAIAFCAGVYFRGKLAWWIPLATLIFTDVALNMYYWLARGWDVWKPATLSYQLFNYVAYGTIFWLGRRFRPRSSFLGLLGGGVLGALLFYIITNTASWFFNPFHNPEYTKTLQGLIIALTKGTNGWPEAWTFFRNTLTSGGLFTALFVGVMKLTAPAESPAEKEAGVREEEPEAEGEPEEAKA
jgi:hypothetical protein